MDLFIFSQYIQKIAFALFFFGFSLRFFAAATYTKTPKLQSILCEKPMAMEEEKHMKKKKSGQDWS